MNFNFDLPYNSNTSFYSGFGLGSALTSSPGDIFFSDEEENDPKPRLPLFGRCPLTNQAFLETTPPSKKEKVIQRPAGLLSDVTNRIPLLQISTNNSNLDNGIKQGLHGSPKKVSWSQVAKKSTVPPTSSSESVRGIFPSGGQNVPSNILRQRASPNNLLPTFDEASVNKRAGSTMAKPSLDEVRDDSLVALTNKHGKGKYWFKSGCPTPDPRWSARQQLMIGPIPGDVEYATLRSAFLSKGHTIHLFIQNNQAWLEKNQEKFGKKQVKFGYVVYTEPEVARRLLSSGHVMVGHAKVKVKEMDGQPAQFSN